MDELCAMKGVGRLVATIASERSTTKLLSYADGSYGIIQDGRIAGTWEPGDHVRCFDTFLTISGAKFSLGAIVLEQRENGVRASGAQSPTMPHFNN